MLLNELNNSFNGEGLTHYFVILFKFDIRELCAQIRRELTRIEFAYYNSLVLAQHIARILRQRANIVELRQIAT